MTETLCVVLAGAIVGTALFGISMAVAFAIANIDSAPGDELRTPSTSLVFVIGILISGFAAWAS